MTTRTTQTVVFFSGSFRLRGFDASHPAGDYRIDYDEEIIEGISRIAWQLVGTSIHLPALGTEWPMQQIVAIEPTDLDTALRKDRQC